MHLTCSRWLLHCALLPHHKEWADLLSNLKYIVVDEAHTMRHRQLAFTDFCEALWRVAVTIQPHDARSLLVDILCKCEKNMKAEKFQKQQQKLEEAAATAGGEREKGGAGAGGAGASERKA